MNTLYIFITLCVICGIWNVVSTLLIYNTLKKWGFRVNFLWLHLLGPKYAFKYKEITKKETGSVGPLFYHWIVSINLALIFVIIAIISQL